MFHKNDQFFRKKMEQLLKTIFHHIRMNKKTGGRLFAYSRTGVNGIPSLYIYTYIDFYAYV
jgi:hypothetical protein